MKLRTLITVMAITFGMMFTFGCKDSSHNNSNQTHGDHDHKDGDGHDHKEGDGHDHK